MKIKLPVTWVECGEIEVEAESIDQAILDFNPRIYDLPENPEYVQGSFELSFTDEDAIFEMQYPGTKIALATSK
jgi:hypothetical protein